MQEYILTNSKLKFYPLVPKSEDILIKDIAHSLSQLARANGHFKHFYSVAQHSINCCREAKVRGYSERVQLGCLLHDASEAYLANITRPVKQHLKEYLTIEEKLQKAIYDKFSVEIISEEELNQIKEIEDAMLFYEFRELMGVDLWEEVPCIAMDHDFSKRDMEAVESEFVLLLEDINVEKKKYISVGIDGTKEGWAVVAVSEEDFEIRICKSLEEAVIRYGDSSSLLIDMPIGLAESAEEMRPDSEARKLLPGRASCIFNAPCRQAVYSKEYWEANEINREVLDKGLSKQSFSICKSIREVDEFLCKNTRFKNRMLEAHPEVCFTMLNPAVYGIREPIYENKKTEEGIEKRLELLAKYYEKTQEVEQCVFNEPKLLSIADDIIDALCLAVTGLVGLQKGFGTIPLEPMTDSRGLKMQMVYGIV